MYIWCTYIGYMYDTSSVNNIQYICTLRVQDLLRLQSFLITQITGLHPNPPMLLKAISSWKASEAPIFWLFPCRLYSRSWPQGRLPQSMQFSKPVIPWYLVDSCGSQASLVVEFRVFHVQQILPVTGHEMLLRSHYPQTSSSTLPAINMEVYNEP